ncbi:TadE/TadG family type IV pilus assembly protein [Sphingomonas kyungheensis]|uniref:TadE/TadG family type IV pilus assembly protein n=1 Tax=Sphingomonas kyungheensis TaxID=1069987 RepID=A0ABU8H2Z9_9SPHN
MRIFRNRSRSGFLSRLRRDRAGNTLAIMAAAMIPLIGFAGSAVDMARLYVVKVRLQQACDAGVLAGRKAMTDTQMSTPVDDAASKQASAFFYNNFRPGWYQNRNISFTTSKASVNTTPGVANAMGGVAQTTVPMALMGFFGIGAQTLTVNCQAIFDVGDADVMFVLDVTGSMTCYPYDSTTCNNGTEKPATTSNGTTTYSKIESLRQSVLLFDKTMRTSADPSTHIRYGFVPYASSVNVGRLIPSQYMQGSWTYQSRHLSPLTGTGGVLAGDYASGDTKAVSLTGVPKAMCVDQRYPSSGFSKTGPDWSTSYPQAMKYYNTSWSSSSGGTCSGREQPLRPYWRFEPVQWDVSSYLTTLTGGTVADPTRFDGSTSAWSGCIEELNTSTASSFDVNNLPDDLNPDSIPSLSTNKWRPMWPDVEWWRGANRTYVDVADESINENTVNYRAGTTLANNAYAACVPKAQRLAVMTAQQVNDYVYDSSFKAFGGTYHDTGMIWGVRLLAPKGVFAADTAAWPGRPAPSRNIVFMTDGTMSPNGQIYGQYGVEDMDNRTGSASNDSRDYATHTARFRIECDAAKKRGISIFVVALGTSITSDLTYCASPGQAFQASSTDALKSAFQTIAQRLAMLRISQ